MQGSRAVQVVLGEGEPGILRFVLEAEGFHVVGQARGETELRRVLDATHPSVIVLDAGISATAAVDARTRATGAQLVVVWPNGVRTSVAEERVDPSTALHDLGGAVRRAAERASGGDEQVVTLPESPEVEPAVAIVRPLKPSTEPRPRGRSRRHLLTVAAALGLALTASAAVGLWKPPSFGLFERRGTPHRPAVSTPGPSPEGRGVTEQPTGTGTPDATSCERSDQGERGRPDEPRGCGHAEARGRGEHGGEATKHRSDGDRGGRADPPRGGDGDGGEGKGSNGPNGKATGQTTASAGASAAGRGGGGGNGPN